MTADRTETDVLLPQDPPQVKLSSGMSVEIKPLKARQFFALLRILTRGAGAVLPNLAATMLDSPERIVTQLSAVLLFAIPEAPDATFEFLREMVVIPTDPIESDSVKVLLADPEMEDVVAIVETIIEAERDDLVSLGKRLMSAFKVAEKTGQLDPSASTQTPDSAPGPDSLTGSAETTAGTTNASSTPPSDDLSNSTESSQSDTDSKTSESAST